MPKNPKKTMVWCEKFKYLWARKDLFKQRKNYYSPEQKSARGGKVTQIKRNTPRSAEMCTNSRDWIFLGIDFIFWSAMTGARQSDVFNNQLGIKQFKSVHLFYKSSSCSENAQAQTHWSEAIKM